MIRVSPTISLDDSEVVVEFVRSSGPGGQNVNKVATAVQLRFDAAASPALTEGVRRRLLALAGSRATAQGEILISASRYRTQHRNRQDAVDRLVSLIQEAAQPPRPRKKTRPTRASKERRIQAKKHRSDTKKNRRPPPTR